MSSYRGPPKPHSSTLLGSLQGLRGCRALIKCYFPGIAQGWMLPGLPAQLSLTL